MKRYIFILPLFVLVLFCSSSCGDRVEQHCIVHNNTDKEIVLVHSFYKSDNQCIIGSNTTKREYSDFMNRSAIKPNSNKNISIIAGAIIAHPHDAVYIYVFDRIDVDTMTCEEFKREYPVRHEWIVTLEDMEMRNWTLVYPPEK